jgi:hypothetical protein
MGGIYEVRRSDGLRCHDIATYIPSFIKTGSSIQKLIREGIHRHTDSMLIAQAYFYFFKMREAG